MKQRYIIGIDPGVNTGIATWDRKQQKLISVECVKIHVAMKMIERAVEHYGINDLFVRVESANLRKWYGSAGKEQLQGAGSIKRDSTIWADYLKWLNIEHEMVAPKNNKTKLNADVFKRMTGWEGRTNNHSRDGAMLCFKY